MPALTMTKLTPRQACIASPPKPHRFASGPVDAFSFEQASSPNALLSDQADLEGWECSHDAQWHGSIAAGEDESEYPYLLVWWPAIRLGHEPTSAVLFLPSLREKMD